MQTVQFQCGHCGSLMGVGVDLLGQQVRCPTCQQIVTAPASAAPAPPEPVSSDSDPENLFLQNLQSAPIGEAPKPAPETVVSSAPDSPAPEPDTRAPAAVEPTPDTSLPWHDAAALAGAP